MTTGRKNFSRTVSLVCISSLLMTLPGISASALENAGISYDFAVEKAGYAQGNITFKNFKKIKVTGEFYPESKIGITPPVNWENRDLTENYSEYNEVY